MPGIDRGINGIERTSRMAVFLVNQLTATNSNATAFVGKIRALASAFVPNFALAVA